MWRCRRLNDHVARDRTPTPVRMAIIGLANTPPRHAPLGRGGEPRVLPEPGGLPMSDAGLDTCDLSPGQTSLKRQAFAFPSSRNPTDRAAA